MEYQKEFSSKSYKAVQEYTLVDGVGYKVYYHDSTQYLFSIERRDVVKYHGIGVNNTIETHKWLTNIENKTSFSTSELAEVTYLLSII